MCAVSREMPQMKRKIYDRLLEWKQKDAGRSALLIDGARRVGKSYIAEEFAKREYKSYVLIDFSKADDDVKDVFRHYLEHLDTFFLKLSGSYGVTLHERNTLFIFDEVQEFPRAREAIKALVADGRYDYLETGSLVSIDKSTRDIVIPSEEDRVKMFPMDFEEFLWAKGDETTMPMIRGHFERMEPLGRLLHRKAMDAGAAVLNPQNFDPATEISGIQHAMNILLRDGEATFMSEYQMQPPRNAFAFELTARHILSRVRQGVPPKTIPPTSVLTVAATDINPGYAITTAITTYDIRMTALVTAYHVTRIRIPENLNDTEFNARLFAALKAHASEIVAQGIHIDKWGIDAGGRQFNTVTAFAPTVAAEFGIEAVAMLGRAGQNWNPNVRSRIRARWMVIGLVAAAGLLVCAWLATRNFSGRGNSTVRTDDLFAIPAAAPED